MANLGSITLNEIQIFEVDADPSIGGLAAPTGSLAILTDGSKMFLKYGEGDTLWDGISPDSKQPISGGTTVASGRQLFNLNSDIVITSTEYTNIADLTTGNLVVGLYRFDFIGDFISNSGYADIKSRVIEGTSVMNIVRGDGSINTKNAPNFLMSTYGILQVTQAGTLTIQIKTGTAGNSITIKQNSALILEKL